MCPHSPILPQWTTGRQRESCETGLAARFSPPGARPPVSTAAPASGRRSWSAKSGVRITAADHGAEQRATSPGHRCVDVDVDVDEVTVYARHARPDPVLVWRSTGPSDRRPPIGHVAARGHGVLSLGCSRSPCWGPASEMWVSKCGVRVGLIARLVRCRGGRELGPGIGVSRERFESVAVEGCECEGDDLVAVHRGTARAVVVEVRQCIDDFRSGGSDVEAALTPWRW